LDIAAINTQADMLVKIIGSIIKYETCWHCGFVL